MEETQFIPTGFDEWETAIYERISFYQKSGWKDWFATCFLQMGFETQFDIKPEPKYLVPFMVVFEKELQRMISEDKLTFAGAIQSSFGGQVFGTI